MGRFHLLLQGLFLLLISCIAVHSEVSEQALSIRDGFASTDDELEIFFAEYVLAHWVLDSMSWTAFHSGIVFRNKRTDAHFTADFTPRSTVLSKGIVPHIHEPSLTDWWKGLLLTGAPAAAKLEWDNLASVSVVNDVPSKYTNFTKLGEASGSIVPSFVNWAVDYNATHTHFDPIEIQVLGDAQPHIHSGLCHDFVARGLQQLYDTGVRFSAKKRIYRDHVFVYAHSYEKVLFPDVSDRGQDAAVLQFYRFFIAFIPYIEQKFTYIRSMLASSNDRALVPFLHIRNEYYKVHLAEPFVNYCYRQVPVPPATTADAARAPQSCALKHTVGTERSIEGFLPEGDGLQMGWTEHLRLLVSMAPALLSALPPQISMILVLLGCGLIAAVLWKCCCSKRAKPKPVHRAAKKNKHS